MGTKVKKAVVIILPLVFAIAASIAVALLVSGGARQTPSDPSIDSPTENGKESDVQVNAPAGSDEQEGYSVGLEYSVTSDGNAEITGMGSCTDKTVRIPTSSPDGRVITSIGDGAFKGETGLQGVILSDVLMKIGDDAFRGSGIRSIELGGSLLHIGSGAFAECSALVEIKVSGANAVYCSSGGVLYDRGMTRLICYPEGKTDASYVIPRTIMRIEAMAMNSAPSLKSLEYGGTEKQWTKVVIGSDNKLLSDIKLKFAPEEK